MPSGTGTVNPYAPTLRLVTYHPPREAKTMKRRNFLGGSVTLLGSSLLAGCDAADRGAAGSAVAAGEAGAEAHEAGATPIASSGWTAPGGVLPGHPRLQGELDAAVVVVGAGLAGSSLALHLAEAGVDVIVLEARQPGWGASGRNAGHVLPTLKDRSVCERFPDGGKAFLEVFREHHTITFDLARRHGIDCDATQAGYLHATNRDGVFDTLKAASVYWRDEHGQRIEYLADADMEAMTGSRYYTRGVLYRSGGRVNPYLFTNGMVAAARARGARVFGDSEALTLSRAGTRWRVATAHGTVIADRVVFCTNAYPTAIVPQFTDNFYPLTAYAISTRPLSPEARALVMPGGATLAQEPVDLNPLVVDRHGRIIVSSIPSASRADDAAGSFARHLVWIHRTWPGTREMDIRMDDYWTGRVALRDAEFPGVFDLGDGVFGLMHFNAWGNLMAPLLGMLFAGALAADRLDRLPFPLEQPRPVEDTGKQHLVIRRLLIPAARLAQRIGVI